MKYQGADKNTAPPPMSAAELKATENEATLTVQKIIVGAILLYLCKSEMFTSVPGTSANIWVLQHRLRLMLLRSLFRGQGVRG